MKFIVQNAGEVSQYFKQYVHIFMFEFLRHGLISYQREEVVATLTKIKSSA